MSKQKGIIKLEGNIGGISFYTSDGQDLARIATGPSKERIQKDKAFQRTRENNTEFGGSAKASKSLRLAMGGLMQTMGGTRIVAQMTALFKSINLKSPGIRGRRPIKLSTNKAMLKNMEFNSKVRFSSVFSAPYTVTANTPKNEATVAIPAFIPNKSVKAPSGATHLKLVAAIGFVSDYNYDAATESYQPAAPAQDGLGAIAYSAELPLDQPVAATSLIASLTGSGNLNAQCSAVVTLGIEFYQLVDGQYYIFSQDSAMKVISVF